MHKARDRNEFRLGLQSNMVSDHVVVSLSDFCNDSASTEDLCSSALRSSLSDGHLSSWELGSISSPRKSSAPWLSSSSMSADHQSDISLEDTFERQSQVSQSSEPSCQLSDDITESCSQCSFSSCLSSQAESTSSAHSQLAWTVWGLSLEGAQGNSEEHLLPDLSLCSQLVRDLHEETGMAVTDLLELDQAGILEQVPRNDEGEMSSVGSMIKHMEGTCTPCVFWFRGCCHRSLMCSFCHFRHPGQQTKRHKPNKRTQAIQRGMKEQQEEQP